MFALVALIGPALAVPVSAFDLTLDLPASAVLASENASTRAWADAGQRLVWIVEQRGTGTGGIAGALPEFARLLGQGMGATSAEPPEPATIAGLEGAQMRFTLPEADAQAWVFRSAGYLYAVTVAVPHGGPLAERAEELRATLKAPPDKGDPVLTMRLADLGWELPGAEGLPVSAVPTGVPTASVTDLAARTTLPAGGEVYLLRAVTGQDREAGLDAWVEQRLAGARLLP